MLRELLYPRAMAGPSLPGHPPQTPNNARCPPQPPSAYILVRGASLSVYPYVSRIHPHPDSAAGTHNIVQILGRVSTCFLLKFAADPALQRPVSATAVEMRTKKTGRLADRASDGEQESDGGSEENSQLPVDSSSDDEDLPASALGGAGRPALGGVSGTQGGAMAHMPPLVPHGHLNTAVPGGVAAVSGQPQNHLSQPHPVSTAAPNASARASGAVAAGADTLRPKAPSQRAAAASEDPTARRLRAQVHCMSSLAATLSD